MRTVLYNPNLLIISLTALAISKTWYSGKVEDIITNDVEDLKVTINEDKIIDITPKEEEILSVEPLDDKIEEILEKIEVTVDGK